MQLETNPMLLLISTESPVLLSVSMGDNVEDLRKKYYPQLLLTTTQNKRLDCWWKNIIQTMRLISFNLPLNVNGLNANSVPETEELVFG